MWCEQPVSISLILLSSATPFLRPFFQEHFPVEEFDIGTLESAFTSDIEVPANARMRQAVDLAMTANPAHSDQSSIAVGFRDDICEIPDGRVRLTVMDLQAGHWQGMGLPKQIVSSMKTWRPEQTEIENIPGAELVRDSIIFQAELQKVPTGRIQLFPRNNDLNAKPNRIRRLQELLSNGLLRIKYGPFMEIVIEQAGDYLFTPNNAGREDGALDVLAFLCGFR